MMSTAHHTMAPFLDPVDGEIELLADPETATELVSHLERYNAACRAVADIAHAERQFDPDRLRARAVPVLGRFKLPDAYLSRIVARVAAAARADAPAKPRFASHAAVPYDRVLLQVTRPDQVTLLTTSGRRAIPTRRDGYQRRHVPTEGWLVLRAGRFFLVPS
jgi:hypothetical protein